MEKWEKREYDVKKREERREGKKYIQSGGKMRRVIIKDGERERGLGKRRM